MNEKRELQVKAAIAGALGDENCLISFYCARKSQSIYVILGRHMCQYLAIRISNHRAFSGFQKVPTFFLRSQEQLAAELSEFLKTATWRTFDYQDFFVLSLVKFGHHHGTTFQIDDSYATFSEETQAMIFYQLIRLGRRQRVMMNALPAELNQALAKLYASDLIGSFSNQQSLLVYLSEGGRRLLDLHAGQYMPQFMQDYQQVDWHNLNLPAVALLADRDQDQS
ncbi:hypothetical protein ACPD8N_03290 [Lacticaseibacillus chiayiensis]|uniref:hypothetical protein n=1 Tax=Lacticaseibacillus chiayiensis TaxID=2100821 RepID=UPI003C79576C